MVEQADPRWTTNGWGYRVTSQDQTFRAITRIVSLSAGRRYVWRGCTDSSYRIRSSLLRDSIIDESEALPSEMHLRRRELAILREAREWGLTLEKGPLASDLYLLAYLQHHGVPTRLLDVTYNPMTALWFACENGEESGVLFAFDVTDFPAYDTIDHPHQRQTYGLAVNPLEWSLRHALAVSARTGSPFLVRPTLRNARMQAQEGLFISGVVPLDPSPSGIDGLPVPFGNAPGQVRLTSLFSGERGAGRPARLPFCAIVIPASIKKKVKGHLTALNRRRSTMYPDVDGFRDALRDGDVPVYPLPDAVSAYDDTDAAGS